MKAGRVRPGLVMVAVMAVGVALLSAVAPASSVAVADVSTGTAGLFVPTQGRILDTRNGMGGYSAPLTANRWTPVTVVGLAGVPATGVSSVQLTLTAVTPSAVGLVSVSPDVASPHGGTALYYRSGDTGSFSNTAIVAVAADGKIVVNSTATIDLLIDVQGYYTAGDAVAAGGFAPVTQTRIANTTNGTNVPQAKVVAGNTLTVQTGGVAGVPADASAVFVDISLINYSTPSGWLAPSSNGDSGGTGLNFPAGTAAGITTAIGTTVPLADDGSFQLYVGPSGSNIHVDMAIDIEGYFDGSTSGGAFTPASTRVLDTRTPSAPIAANATVNYQISGVNGVPAMSTGISAVFANLQVINGTATSGGYLRTWPSDQPEPTGTSDLNYLPNSVRSNTVSVQLSAAGKISIHNVASFAINLVIDVQGWFGDPGPAVPLVSSAAYQEESWAPTATGPASFSLQPTGGAATDHYVYTLDGASPSLVSGATATITLSPQGIGQHVLAVTALDSAGIASAEYDYTFYVGSAPSAPASVTVWPTTGVAAVTWTPSSDNGTPVTAYHITVTDQTTSTSYDQGSCATCSQFVVTGLTPGDSYVASVSAISDAGEGQTQASTSFIADTGAPGDCPNDAGCVIQPLATPVGTSMDDSASGVFPQTATTSGDDYYASSVSTIADDGTMQPDSVWSGYHLPAGYKRPYPNAYVWDTIKLAHLIKRCKGGTTTCTTIGQVNLWVREYLNGGPSQMWDDQVHAEWVWGPRYYVEAEYQCARNISGAPDNFCTHYNDKADGYDSEILTNAGTGNYQYDWWHHFGNARNVVKYQMLRLLVKWPDQNTVSRGADGDYGTKLRMYDVKRDSKGRAQLADYSGTGL